MLARLLALLGLCGRPARVASSDRARLGALGEEAAARYLASRGYRILARNYRCRIGELDIVALDGEVICFVEVKTRGPDPIFPPSRSVTARKRRKLRSLARHYLRHRKLRNRICRFDVVSVVYPEVGQPQVELIRHAF